MNESWQYSVFVSLISTVTSIICLQLEIRKKPDSQCNHPPFTTCCFCEWKRWKRRPDYRGNKRFKWIRLNLNAASVSFFLVVELSCLYIIPKSQKLSFQRPLACSLQVLIQVCLLKILNNFPFANAQGGVYRIW